eukprot:8174371-Lingulodinium_polyedra.AAC.1
MWKRGPRFSLRCADAATVAERGAEGLVRAARQPDGSRQMLGRRTPCLLMQPSDGGTQRCQ